MGIKFSNQNILEDDNGYLAHILPNEIFFPICDHLTTADISRLAQSCRHINRRVNEYLNYRVTDQMIGHWQQVCSDHRDLLSPDEQLLAQTELVENKHLSLFLSVYANIHGEDIRRYSTSEHSTPQPSLNTTPCISMYGTQYQTMEDQTVSREVVFIDITKWLFFHFHAEVEPYQTYEVSVMMKLEKNFNWPHRSDQVTDWIIVQDVKQPTCISVDRTWWRNIHKNRPVPDIDGLRVVKEAKGWIRVILPPVRTNHRKEIRVRMIDRDHSLRKGGIKIDIWQMRKLGNLAMRSETVLSRAVSDRLQELLGGGPPSQCEAARLLVQHSAGHVWLWSWRDHHLLLAGTGQADSVQTVELEARPHHEVTGVAVSKTGLWVALWGPGGLTAVQMPPRVGGRFGGGRERLRVRGVSLHTEDVQMVKWHPASAAESHLVSLAKSGSLSLYNLLEPEDSRLVRQVSVTSHQTSKLSAALGEAAVDFCFGSQMESGSGWPLFVVSGNCDVHCVSAGLAETNWEVEGPLEVRPRLEDNYSGGEGCGLVEVGGVLALATTMGAIYHAIILGGDTTSLHVYERVELEIGAVTSRDVFSCPLSLSAPDSPHSSPGYLVSHPAGLHSVSLPMVTVLRSAAAAGCLPELEQGKSVVSHLLCTRPAPSSPSAPPLGACLTFPKASVLCLLATNSLTSLPLPQPPLPAPDLLASQASDICERGREDTLDCQLTSLLSRQASQPLLAAAPTTSLSPALSLELLTGVTSRLRREYLARLEVARKELVRRVTELQNRRSNQEKQLRNLEQQRVKAKIPQLSDKELAMAREVAGLDRKVASLEGGVKQLREKEKYQRYQIGVEGRQNVQTVRDGRLDNMKEVLQRDSRSIADLVKSVNQLKKVLGM